MNMVQSGIQQATGSQKSGDVYEFKLLFPYHQNEQVTKMVKEFKDVFITNSKQYQFDDNTGVLVIHTIPSEEKEKACKKLIQQILDKNDLQALLLIKHPDDFVAKLAGMKIKYFDKQEFQTVESLFQNDMLDLYED